MSNEFFEVLVSSTSTVPFGDKYLSYHQVHTQEQGLPPMASTTIAIKRPFNQFDLSILKMVTNNN